MLEDKLELDIEDIKTQTPIIDIGELIVNNISHTWHTQWRNLRIDKFVEPFEKVRDKIVYFYSLEKNRCTPVDGTVVIRRPGHAILETQDSIYKINVCKILNCFIDEPEIALELVIDGVNWSKR